MLPQIQLIATVQLTLKITERVSAVGGITSYFPIDYEEGNMQWAAFTTVMQVQFLNNSGVTTGTCYNNAAVILQHQLKIGMMSRH